MMFSVFIGNIPTNISKVQFGEFIDEVNPDFIHHSSETNYGFIRFKLLKDAKMAICMLKDKVVYFNDKEFVLNCEFSKETSYLINLNSDGTKQITATPNIKEVIINKFDSIIKPYANALITYERPENRMESCDSLARALCSKNENGDISYILNIAYRNGRHYDWRQDEEKFYNGEDDTVTNNSTETHVKDTDIYREEWDIATEINVFPEENCNWFPTEDSHEKSENKSNHQKMGHNLTINDCTDIIGDDNSFSDEDNWYL